MHLAPLSRRANNLIDQRLQPGASPKRDMLQSFISQGLRGEALKQEVGMQLWVAPFQAPSSISLLAAP